MKTIRWMLSTLLAPSAALFLSGCEVELGNPETESQPSYAPVPGYPQPQAPANNNNNGGNVPDPGDNGGDDGGNPTSPAPGVPSALSPGDGESFSGGGAKVTMVWTDAEHAVQFEVIVQALGSGGWQGAARKVTDDFQFTYTPDNPAWTQYRWMVRSIGQDGQVSGFTGARSFTWTP